MKALLPALLLGALAFWSGSFAGGATFSGALSAHAAILLFALLGLAGWRDPLALGPRARWLLPLLLLVAAASWLSSPVSRAGLVGLLLLPAFLLGPAAAAACWRDDAHRDRGLAAVGLLLGGVALVSLILWQVQGSPRAAMPLGHHNLLALWLILLWPIGLLGLSRLHLTRLPTSAAAVAVVLALAATGSFLAACALLIQALIAAVWWRRARPWLVIATLVVWIGPALPERLPDRREVGPAAADQSRQASDAGSGVQGASRFSALRRIGRFLAAGDSSAAARAVYARAGWEGWKESPILGWGPGSVPWTVSGFLEPARRSNPPSEVVADLHSWPLQLGYETGIVGAGLATLLVAFFCRRRVTELRRTADRDGLQTALLGLAGGGLMLLGNAAMYVLAIPAALAVVAGAALSTTPGAVPKREEAPLSRLAAGAYLLLAAALLFPLERAHLAYQRAAEAGDSAAALRHILRAARIDSGFPLYRARAAWLQAEVAGVDSAMAGEARRAAEEARHVAPFWLAAGTLGLEAGEPWAGPALETARRLDPLAPLPAFHLMRAEPDRQRAVELGVEAVRSDPRLGAATFWEQNPELREAVLDRLPPNSEAAIMMRPTDARGPTLLLAQSMDRQPALSFSLFAFRRSPWPADFAAVEVRASRLPSRRSPPAGAPQRPGG